MTSTGSCAMHRSGKPDIKYIYIMMLDKYIVEYKKRKKFAGAFAEIGPFSSIPVTVEACMAFFQS